MVRQSPEFPAHEQFELGLAATAPGAKLSAAQAQLCLIVLAIATSAGACADNGHSRQTTTPQATTSTRSATTPTPSSPYFNPGVGGRTIPIRLRDVRVVSAPETMFCSDQCRPSTYASNLAIIRWRIGPPCTDASAWQGTFHAIKVARKGADLKLTLRLRHAIANPPKDPRSFLCRPGVPTYYRIVQLPGTTKPSQIIDGACGCPAREMSRADARAFLSSLAIT